jgi:hypothetical protein
MRILILGILQSFHIKRNRLTKAMNGLSLDGVRFKHLVYGKPTVQIDTP